MMRLAVGFFTCVIALSLAGCGGGDTDSSGGGDGDQTGAGLTPQLDKVKSTAGDMVDQAKDTANDAKNNVTDAADTAQDAVDSAKDQATEKANSMITEVTKLVKDGKLDQAKGLLEKLQGMKGNLPDGVKSNIDKVQKLFDAEQAAGSLGF